MSKELNSPKSKSDVHLPTRRQAERTFYRFMAQSYEAFSAQMKTETEQLADDPDYKVPKLIAACQVAYPEKYRRFSESPTGIYIFFFLKDSTVLTLQVGHKETDGQQQGLGDTPALTADEVVSEIENMIIMSLENENDDRIEK